MARTRDPQNDLIRRNLCEFRKGAKLTTEQAAQLSGVSIDNLRRYESGKSGVPADVIRRLAPIYGHTMEDFFLESPPAPNLSARPHFHLSVLPGVDVDRAQYEKLKAIVDKANSETRPHKSPPKK